MDVFRGVVPQSDVVFALKCVGQEVDFVLVHQPGVAVEVLCFDGCVWQGYTEFGFWGLWVVVGLWRVVEYVLDRHCVHGGVGGGCFWRWS